MLITYKSMGFFFCSFTELTDVCDVHFINKGIIFSGNNATIYVQPTGPDPDARILNLECRCREIETVFTPCKF